MGLAMLVYPATQVLPLGMIATVVLGVMPASAKTQVLLTSPKRLALLTISGIIGVLVTFGAQLTYIISHGYLSRLNSTFILQPHNIKHISSAMRVESATERQVVVFNLLQTLKFFYASDSGEQYNFTRSPLPIWMVVFAIVGVGVICRMALRREPNSIYILTISLATFFASALMVEANFSPHLVLFALIIPLVCALGINSFFARVEGLKNWVFSLVLAAGLLVWSHWNWGYYSRVVDPLRSRISSIQTRFLNLPVANLSVNRFVNLSEYHLKFDESHVQLVYPNGKASVIDGGSAEERARLLDLNTAGLTLLLVDRAVVEKVAAIFKERGARVELFEYPGIPISFLNLQTVSPG
jgi:hypothetical protein